MHDVNSEFDAGIEVNMIFSAFGASYMRYYCMSAFASDNFVRNRLGKVTSEIA